MRSFIKLSYLYADRPDIVQAGGGNSSFKKDDTMFIKASGYSLHEMTTQKGFTCVEMQPILNFFKTAKDPTENDGELLLNTVNRGSAKPSIETFLHALVPFTYVLHTHPLVVNLFSVSLKFKEMLASQFEQKQSVLFIPYNPPGINLAMLFAEYLNKYQDIHKKYPDYVIFQNHGLLAYDDHIENLEKKTENILNYYANMFNYDLTKESNQTKISRAINKTTDEYQFIYNIQDKEILDNFNFDNHVNLPIMPDVFIYCGNEIVQINDLTAAHFSVLPKVIYYENNLYTVSNNYNKCRDIADVLKQQVLAYTVLKDSINTLTSSDVIYLSNMASEKYRQTLKKE